MGYRRKNGRVGVRNYVIILPLDDLSNAACEAVANNIKGALAIPHSYGRLQFGEDLELSRRITSLGFTSGLIPEAYVYHKRKNNFLHEFIFIFQVLFLRCLASNSDPWGVFSVVGGQKRRKT